jgi:hypothetical protein
MLAVVAVLLAVALRGPLWFTRMESPQYRGEEALEVIVYAGQMRGDLREIKTLNKYIGVRMPENIPELGAAPWTIGSLFLLALLALFLPAARRRKAALALFVLMLLVLITGTGLLERRLKEFGHDRTHSIIARVPDFSPPLLGTAKIANFTVHAGPGYGAWAFGAALLLTGWAVFSSQKKRETILNSRKQEAEDCHAELVQRS